MQLRPLGQSPLRVSPIGLGCMGMSEFYAGHNDDDSLRTFHHALARGINFIDTADMYGPFTNERLVGRALKETTVPRDQLVIATKFGIERREDDPSFRAYNGKPDYVRSACDASLARLGTDVIDLYYLHRVDPDTPIEETVAAMESLRKAGKIRCLGLSETSAATLRRAAAVATITAVQSEYSLWSRDYEADVIPLCRTLSISFVAYAPLGRGFLTGRIQQTADLAPDDFRNGHPRFAPENFEKNLRLLEQFQSFARQKNCTPAQLALAWVLAQGHDITALAGMRRLPHVDENLGALSVSLTAADVDSLNTLFPPNAASGDRFPPSGMRSVNR